jgi:hypothetical protein
MNDFFLRNACGDLEVWEKFANFANGKKKA